MKIVIYQNDWRNKNEKILFGILLAIIGGFLIICPNDDIAFVVGRILLIISIIIGIYGLNEKEQ